MWQTLIIEEFIYIYKVVLSDNGVHISISKFTDLWDRSVSKDYLIEQFQNSNPLYEGTAEDTFAHCCDMINNLSTIEVPIFTENSCILTFKKQVDILPLKLQIHLHLKLENEHKQQIVIPMIQTIQYLEFKQKKLEELLSKKDREIAEYKHEYGEITRNMITTEIYIPDLAPKKELFLNVFSQDRHFLDVFTKSNEDVQQLYPEVKQVYKEKRPLELAPSRSRKKLSNGSKP